ncbi:MAG TPA: SDR family oxidoreductase [Solirubrobacteraceae bacterium]|jgi:thioester reductase-like protein|nr:SDR family oxidoreductase [Solirubrobacteraceae bacterium]
MGARGEVLLTGGTGFVGMEVLARYLERGNRRVVLLVRAEDDTAARARVDATMRDLFGIVRARRYAGRVEAVASELTAPQLGLTDSRRDELAERVSTIVHSAASVSFTLPLDEARAINLDGTRRMLDFAELACDRGGLDRYAHVSTAYVAGTHAGRFSECDLDVGQEFHNSYEQSKWESERLVHDRTSVPSTIMRPSIVVGDRNSGWTAAFNVMYWPLRAFARGLYSAVPADPSAPLDVVSIDYVADAIHALCEMPGGIGETYHLTAGANASTIGEVAELASRYFHRPTPAVLSPADFAIAARDVTATQRAALESSVAYFPYFAIGTTFDDTAARARLDPREILVSPLRDYLTRLLDFATASRWGKRPIGRAEALAA